MAVTIQTSFGSMIEDTLRLLYRTVERPAVLYMTTPLTSSANSFSINALTGANTTLQVGDTIEVPGSPSQELMLVNSKSTDANPVYGVIRGWEGTPVSTSTVPTTVPLNINPTWVRYDVGKSIVRCMQSPMTQKIPELVSYTDRPTSNQFYMNLPADCIKPVRMSYRIIYTSGGVYPFVALTDFTGWRYEDDLPTGTDSTRIRYDGVGNGTTTFTSATAVFSTLDVGSFVSEANNVHVPLGTTITAFVSNTTVILSNPVATGVAIVFTILGQPGTGNITFPTGKAVWIPPRLAIVGVNAPTSVVDIFITYERQYQWTPAGGGTTTNTPVLETDTCQLPIGAQDCPSLYAAAYVVTGRELSRLQVDRMEQWQQEASLKAGVSIRIVQQWWKQFYDTLEEARDIKPRRLNRPYRKLRKL